MGTVGDKGLGKKLNKKQREITETGGTVVQMGLKGSMFDEATNDPNFNPELVSLMADRDWWKYNKGDLDSRGGISLYHLWCL